MYLLFTTEDIYLKVTLGLFKVPYQRQAHDAVFEWQFCKSIHTISSHPSSTISQQLLQHLAWSAFAGKGVAVLNTTKEDISTFLSCLALRSQATTHLYSLDYDWLAQDKPQMLINRFGLNNRLFRMPRLHQIGLATWALFELTWHLYLLETCL